ncbi:PncB Nicotinic acid phosphoribosyltransferase [uncultured Caudovirales phage]|uniref:Nicotinamide phosphoribosyltransferase n=1 Tax=uncultured Caudovirales phage TaxID=2100421 RepID=A0A6J5NU74_9CAUD|nr:PncB Nicotinic acid phosphoribosyltransferase [uncultured Caudovirales phage]
MEKNIILNSDSYKYSQWNQYPEGTEIVYSYIESRGGKWDSTVFFGLQMFLKEYLAKPVTMEDIDEAEAIILAHGEPFNRAGWEYIVREHGGKLPVEIRAVPEGTIVPNRNVLVTIENTDPECYWLTSFLETALLRAVWYPTTVATNSYESKKIIRRYLEKTGDVAGLPFKLHDFGFRGVSSFESAGLGGAAHLVNFMGTDTVAGLLYARKYYGADMAGFSIPAMEHSTVTSWGRTNELEAYRNMLNKYAKPGAILAAVSDSYDIYNACRMWGTELKQQIIDSGATLVVRPDSGDPVEVVTQCLNILDTHFGSVVNEKGYKVLNNVRVIQGDGINQATIANILEAAEKAGFSADNLAFGQGGALLQEVNRDTLKFAMKCSAARINGKWVSVFKDPITDQGKKSKQGRVTLFKNFNGEFYSGVQDWMKDQLDTVYLNGNIVKEYTFDEVRVNAQKG